MKNKQRGFTLIELLVVVLIIGILAAVALPQYQKSVARARAAEAVTNGTVLLHALERYHLANGTYTKDLADLDVSVPKSDFYHYNIQDKLNSGTEYWRLFAGANKTGLPNFEFPVSFQGKKMCFADKTDTIANDVCKTYAPFSYSSSTANFYRETSGGF